MSRTHDCPNPNCTATDIPNGQGCYKCFWKDGTTMPTLTEPTPANNLLTPHAIDYAKAHDLRLVQVGLEIRAYDMDGTYLTGAEHWYAIVALAIEERRKLRGGNGAAAGGDAIRAYGHIAEGASNAESAETTIKGAKDAKSQIDDILFCAYKFDDKPHQLFNAIRRVAESSTRLEAKDKIEIVRLMNEEYERPSRATLTRQLETARTRLAVAIQKTLDFATCEEDDPRSCKEIVVHAAFADFVGELRSILAAIDAPAAEAASTTFLAIGCFNGEHSKCSKTVTRELACDCQCHSADYGSEVAHPPEPANAQGSEVARSKTCGYVGCKNLIPDNQDFCGQRNCGSISSRCQSEPSSAPPFTAEEARDWAALGTMAPRLGATLRRYADLLDRQSQPRPLHSCIRYPNLCHVTDLRDGERCYKCHALPPSVAKDGETDV